MLTALIVAHPPGDDKYVCFAGRGVVESRPFAHTRRVRASKNKAGGGRCAAAALAAILAIAGPFAGGARADDLDAPHELALPEFGDTAWHEIELPRVARKTIYVPVDIDGRRALRADSRCSASGYAVPLGEVDLEATPRLAWEWRIDSGMRVAEERSKAGDDFAARVMVLFDYESEKASWLDRVLNRIGRRLYGGSLPGRALSYVWTSDLAPGTSWENPYRSPTVLISRGRGPQGDWRSESVDVLADYRKSFGEDPPPVFGVAVMTDSDNTCQAALAHYAGLRFVGPP